MFGQAATEALRELDRLGYVPQTDQIVHHIDDVRETMQTVVADQAAEAASYGRRKTAQSLGIRAEAFANRTIEVLRERAFRASAHTLRRVSGNVAENLEDSVRAGLGTHETADRLRDVFRRTERYELRRIARTEVNRAQQEGAFETERELGISYHQWLTAEDERVRGSHVALNDQIVRFGEPFANGLVRPGDSSGPYEEWINCRCRLAPFIPPEGKTAPPDRSHFWPGDVINIER